MFCKICIELSKNFFLFNIGISVYVYSYIYEQTSRKGALEKNHKMNRERCLSLNYIKVVNYIKKNKFFLKKKSLSNFIYVSCSCEPENLAQYLLYKREYPV